MLSMTYVALLRGIMPTNPNMRSAKLKIAFEKMGLKNVRTVIASGNVVFESPLKPVALETKIEAALPKILNFKSTTIVRSRAEIEKLLKKEPFKKANPELYRVVTFLKKKSNIMFPTKGVGFRMYASYERELCIAVDSASSKTPEIMRLLEKNIGKEIATRTWKTVGRIATTMKNK